MKIRKEDLKKISCIVIEILLISIIFQPLSSGDFNLPPWGGGVIHQDPQTTENIRLPGPTSNESIVWGCGGKGASWGTNGNGIVGNGKIAACSFNNVEDFLHYFFPKHFPYGYNNLILYNYYGDRLWSDTQYLNAAAAFSSPMIDNNSQVVACDNETIILVNASNESNIHVVWHNSIPISQFKLRKLGPTPFSPCIVENKTIILPCADGPVLAYDVKTGNLTGEIFLGENTTIDPYYCVPEMTLGDFIKVVGNYFIYSICLFRYNSTSQKIEWNSTVPYGVFPRQYQNCNFTTNSADYGKVDFVVKRNNVTEFQCNNTNGDPTDSIIASNSIITDSLSTGSGYFSGINSICVKNNTFFILTEYKKPDTLPVNRVVGRIYAINVTPAADNKVNLTEYWNYTYWGESQASPTLINDTIYFDGYNTSHFADLRDPHIYAVYTNGTPKWTRNFSNYTGNITWFTFTRDPRGGFWYEDSNLVYPNHRKTGDDKLFRFREDNGFEIEEINITSTMNKKDKYNNTIKFVPSSDMTICGTPANPIMLITAYHEKTLYADSEKYVLALNLSHNNTPIFKIPICSYRNISYAVGDYTILKENGEYRIVFPLSNLWYYKRYGILAIGRFPNSLFTNISSKPWKSTNTWNDSMNATYTIKTSVKQDRSHLKAILTSKDYPILCRYTSEKNTTVTSVGTTDNITDTLPPYAPAGLYNLTVYLYNSSGYCYRKEVYLPGILDHGQYSNDSYQSGEITLHPPNNPPATPRRPTGNTTIYSGKDYNYTTNTTDPNGNPIWYQWRWNTSLGVYYYTRWITGGPHPSGQTCTQKIRWMFPGTYQIQVRAKDNPYSLNATDWSPPLNITATQKDNGLVSSWDSLFQGQFASTTITESQPASCPGFNAGIGGASQSNGLLNWTWHFGDGTVSYNQNIQHTYSHLGTFKVNLTIRNGAGNTYNTTQNISVIILRSNFNITGNPQPGQTAYFHDLSQGAYPIVNWTWNFHDGNYSYEQNANHTFNATGIYNVTLTTHDNQNNVNTYNHTVYVESIIPGFVDVESSPNPIPCGFPVTISANFFDNQSGVKTVRVNITNPNNQSYNYTMQANYSTPYDYNYTFNNTWQPGQYNYTIWIVDNANNTNILPGFTFQVVPTPTIIFTTPFTPQNNSVLNHNWVTVNTTIQDTRGTVGFIDWNRNLKGYWPMEAYNTTGVTDNSTYDSFGRFHNGLGPSNIVAGKFGKALDFDGTDDYVDLGKNTSLNLGTSDFTFMVWEKSHQNTYSNVSIILSNKPEAGNKGYFMGVTSTGARLYTMSAAGQVTCVNGTRETTNNAWHHLAYVRTGTNLSLYVDGAFDHGIAGTIRNVTNTQNTSFSYENHASWSHFDGLLDEPQLYTRALSLEEIKAAYDNSHYNLAHNFTGLTEGTYSYNAQAIDTTGNHSSTETRHVTIDTTGPVITSISASPSVLGFGHNVTIQATIMDNATNVEYAKAEIWKPTQWQTAEGMNITMNAVSGSSNSYRCVFNDTWLTGRYNYTITAVDTTGNERTTSKHSFNVSVTATLAVYTLKNSYTSNEYINLTDPPAPPDNYTLINRGATWNTFHDPTTGSTVLDSYPEQVNYQPTPNDWQPINTTLTLLPQDSLAYAHGYYAGNDHGPYAAYFKPNIQSTWPIAFAYNRSTDPTTVVRTQLTGVGYIDPTSWSTHTLQTTQSSQGLFTNNTATYPGIFTGTNVTYTYENMQLKEAITLSNTTKALLQSHPPSQYGLSNNTYLVFATKIDSLGLTSYDGQDPITGNITITQGIEFKDALNHFACALPIGTAYEQGNTSATMPLVYRIIHLNGDTYLLSGLPFSALTTMTFPIVIDPTITVYSLTNDGYIYSSSTTYNTAWTALSGTISSTATSLFIGQDKTSGVPPTYNIYRGMLLFNTTTLPNNANITSATLSLYKYSDNSSTDFTITVQNGQPTYPHDPLQTADYGKSHYSGNGGGLNTTGFGTGYNTITLTNYSWLQKRGETKLCLRSNRDISGTTPTTHEYVKVYSGNADRQYTPKLTILFNNQSKINNTGSTDIKGYLLIQVQFYKSGTGWIVDNDTVHETTPRTITASHQFGLDTVFNGKIKRNDLKNGNGMYRIYAAFRDPDGNILVGSDLKQLVSSYQFTVSGL